MNHRQKRFICFTVPVLNYNNPLLFENNNYTGLLTWVWVMDSHEYMLYYPHNFMYTSLYTLSIVVEDYALDYNNKSPVSIEGFGVDLNKFDEYDVAGYCDQQCVNKSNSCGIGERSLKQFLLNVTQGKDKYEWNWLCLQVSYDIADFEILPHHVIPDLLYYWRFLKLFFTKRPIFGQSEGIGKISFTITVTTRTKINIELKANSY